MKNKFTLFYCFLTIFCFYIIIKFRWIGDNGEAWKYIIASDGRGYYAYLPACLIYHDLKYEFVYYNEWKLFGDEKKADRLKYINGEWGNKYFAGISVLILPFFVIAVILSFLTHQDIDGYNYIFQGAVSFSSLFYFLAGLWFLKKLLQLYSIKEKNVLLTLIALAFGTNLLYYSLMEPSMSHAYSFFLISGFLYLIKKFNLEKKKKHVIASALMLGLICLVRPSNIIIIFALFFITESPKQLKGFFRQLPNPRFTLISCLLIFIFILSIQPMLWYATSGNLIVWPYRQERFNFLHPEILNVLFSFKKGLFIYTPLIFISCLGLYSFFKENRFLFFTFLVFILLLIYILSSWWIWYYGGSFGLRPFIDFYPVFGILLSKLLNNSNRPIKIFFIIPLISFCVLLNIFQSFQYYKSIIEPENMTREKYFKNFFHLRYEDQS